MNEEFNIQKAREFLAERERQRKTELDRLFDQATRDAEQIIVKIRDEFRPKRIWQWGSLLDRASFREYSDIDIAVEGIQSPREFFAIVGAAMRMTSFSVDVVEMEQIRPEVANRIRKKGRLVYEREDQRAIQSNPDMPEQPQ